MSALFQEITLGSMRLRNRIAMAPMTRESSPAGVPTDAVRDYYRRRAAGGTGLIITEGCSPDLTGSFGVNVPRMYGHDAQAGWGAVCDAVHEEGAAIMAQLWHVGAFEPSLIGMKDSYENPPERLGPSGLAAPDKPYGRAMTVTDIDQAIESFAKAAVFAKQCGFDAVEVHGAHGYLPDQFLWSGTNRRDDSYGSPGTRFSVELIKAIRDRCGADFPISFRLSQWKQFDYSARIAETPAEYEVIVTALADAGVTMLHCSTRLFWEPAFEDDQRSLAAWTRALTGLPVIAVGAVTLGNDFKSSRGKIDAKPAPEQIEQISECIQRGDFDVIAIGRAILANPDWAELVSAGRAAELKAFSGALLADLI